MRSLASFWSACERLASTGVMKEWEMEIKDKEVLDAAKLLLVPTRQPSDQYPCTASPRCECVHEVVTHRDGSVSACCVCDEPGCGPIPLTREDVVQYQVDFPRVLSGLATAAGIDPLPLVDLDLTKPVHFADLKVDELTAVPAYFFLGVRQIAADPILDLLASDHQPFILFTISPLDVGNARNLWQRESRLFISISDLFSIADGGRLAVSLKLKTAVEGFVERLSVNSKVERVRMVHKDSVFHPSNDYRTIVLRGETLPHLSPLQADVARILHEAEMSGDPEMSYAAIACKLAEMHSQDIGFEAPDKMSKIFRSGDERGKLIESTKRGFFRLNID